MIDNLNYLEEKESLMQIKLAIGGEKMGKNIEAKITNITQKAVRAIQLEKEVQNLQRANYELRSEVIKFDALNHLIRCLRSNVAMN